MADAQQFDYNMGKGSKNNSKHVREEAEMQLQFNMKNHH